MAIRVRVNPNSPNSPNPNSPNLITICFILSHLTILKILPQFGPYEVATTYLNTGKQNILKSRDQI